MSQSSKHIKLVSSCESTVLKWLPPGLNRDPKRALLGCGGKIGIKDVQPTNLHQHLRDPIVSILKN